MKSKVGLVLTGGGARGAYQAGVLLGIADMTPREVFPFPIITGVSAGSINAGFLACSEKNFHESARDLWDIWQGLTSNDVFRQRTPGFASMAVRALINVVLSKVILKPKWPASLLDNIPLKELLLKNLNLHGVQTRITRGDLYAVGFSATDFSSQMTTTFFEAHKDVKPWLSKDCLGLKTRLMTSHVMASSAIPAVFRLEQIGDSFYGDGSSRLTFPVAPALHLGADKVLAIDMRHERTVSQKKRLRSSEYPELGVILASLLDTLFSDSLERDMERLEIVNELARQGHGNPTKWRCIPIMLIRPSKSLASLAEDIFPALSLPLRQILTILGIKKGQGADLVSHLAFETIYTERLLKLGRADALDQRSKLMQFLEIAPGLIPLPPR